MKRRREGTKKWMMTLSLNIFRLNIVIWTALYLQFSLTPLLQSSYYSWQEGVLVALVVLIAMMLVVILYMLRKVAFEISRGISFHGAVWFAGWNSVNLGIQTLFVILFEDGSASFFAGMAGILTIILSALLLFVWIHLSYSYAYIRMMKMMKMYS